MLSVAPGVRPGPSGVVLAGGEGRRLGRPKASVVLGGRPLAARATGLLSARCPRVVVVTRPGIPMPVLGVPVLMDRPGPDAPLTGLATGLAALGSDDVLVLACDLPAAGPALDLLLGAPPGIPVVAVAPDGRAQPLCARYPRARALAAAERVLARGEASMRALLDELAPLPVEVPAESLRNVNTRADLLAAAG